MKKAIFQGQSGSFSQLALKQFLQKNKLQYKLCNKKTFLDLCLGLENDEASMAILPIENSLAGSVIENYDLLQQRQVKIVGEIIHPINLQLLAVKKVAIRKIDQVFSHPKALEQTSIFFQKHAHLKPIETLNTAIAAAEVASSKNPKIAAIASLESQQEYGLEILAENIQNHSNNWTRFLILKKRNENQNWFEEKFENGGKAFVSYTLPKHIPGSLVKSLKILAEKKINLVNIESRPILGKKFEYLFYIELEFTSKQTKNVQNCLQKLNKQTNDLKILGVYELCVNY